MPQQLSLTALLVDDYDEAIGFYVGKLGFELREDTPLPADKRWVVVAPRGAASGLLLARADGDRQRQAIGDQSGGRVFLFLETDDFARDHLATRSWASALSKRPGMSPMARWLCSKMPTATGGT